MKNIFPPEPIDRRSISDWIIPACLIVIFVGFFMVLFKTISNEQRMAGEIITIRMQIEQIRAADSVIQRQIDGLRQKPQNAPAVKTTAGKASWLNYRLSDSCAATKWAKGTKLLIKSNGKTAICVVRDFGPDQRIHPDRIVDLNKEVFAKLANPDKGIINVIIQQL